MDPTTITATTIAALVLNKAFEKVGEALGQTAWQQGSRLAKMLRQQLPPETTATIEQAQPSAAYDRALAEIEAVTEQNREVAATLQVMMEAIRSQPQGVTTLNKIAQQYLAPVTTRSMVQTNSDNSTGYQTTTDGNSTNYFGGTHHHHQH